MKLMLALTPILLLLLVCSVDATTTLYTNTYLGIPNYNTYLNFDESRTFSTVYRSGNNWIIDNYRFSVQNANATITGLFDSPNILTATVHGSVATESKLTINASAYGYIRPTTITYTGVVTNIYHTTTATELQLYATHEVDGNLEYEISWGSGSGGEGSGYTPPTEEPETPPEEEEPTEPSDPTVPSLPHFTLPDVDPKTQGLLLIGGIIAIVALTIVVESSKRTRRKSPTKAYSENKRKRKSPDYRKRKKYGD